MNNNSSIELRIENIKTIFQDAKKFAGECDDIDTLLKHLENFDLEFRSVAYEGTAMSLAQKDFTKNNSLNFWNSLLNVSPNHAGQIHIGLGWAIAESKPNDLAFFDSINSKMQFRVWDGCGYYDGIFRQRQTIKNQMRPDFVKEKNFKAYDEGVGRSFWYNCKGDPSKVSDLIQTFSPSRYADLWRGVGIACSYVGGSDENIFKNLYSMAEKNAVQLSIGAAMVAKSRILGNSITKDIERTCIIWCNLSVNEAMLLTTRAESSADTFESFLLQMEAGISNAKRAESL